MAKRSDLSYNLNQALAFLEGFEDRLDSGEKMSPSEMQVYELVSSQVAQAKGRNKKQSSKHPFDTTKKRSNLWYTAKERKNKKLRKDSNPPGSITVVSSKIRREVISIDDDEENSVVTEVTKTLTTPPYYDKAHALFARVSEGAFSAWDDPDGEEGDAPEEEYPSADCTTEDEFGSEEDPPPFRPVVSFFYSLH